jgi:hypothetical protein
MWHLCSSVKPDITPAKNAGRYSKGTQSTNNQHQNAYAAGETAKAINL